MKNSSIFKVLIAGVLTLACSFSQAQMRVEISGVGSNQIPIAVAAFANEELSPQLVSTIIRDDLNRSGYFKLIEVGAAISETAVSYTHLTLPTKRIV